MARRGLQRRQPLRNGHLVTPRVTWPPFDAGLSMEIFGSTPDGAQLFRYVHSTAYRVRCPRLSKLYAAHSAMGSTATRMQHVESSRNRHKVGRTALVLPGDSVPVLQPLSLGRRCSPKISMAPSTCMPPRAYA